MNLDKIGYGENPDKVKAIIEIACGSNIKYEVEKESGALVLDRVMQEARLKLILLQENRAVLLQPINLGR